MGPVGWTDKKQERLLDRWWHCPCERLWPKLTWTINCMSGRKWRAEGSQRGWCSLRSVARLHMCQKPKNNTGKDKIKQHIPIFRFHIGRRPELLCYLSIVSEHFFTFFGYCETGSTLLDSPLNTTVVAVVKVSLCIVPAKTEQAMVVSLPA